MTMLLSGLAIGGLLGYIIGTALAIGTIEDMRDDNKILVEEIKRLRGEDETQ